MIPTREDLIRYLTAERQATVAVLALHFTCTVAEAQQTLDANDDFEHGYSQAWRLSVLATNPDTRMAALRQQRDIEQPPQARRRDYTSARPAGSAASVLLDWLRANPGEWTLAQIAEARGVGIVTVRQQLKVHRSAVVTRLEHIGHHGGKHLLISLKPHHAA